MVARPMIASVALAALHLMSVAQDPDQVLAHFLAGGKPAVVTRGDAALEMASHLRHRDEGRQAADLLVDSWLVRREAEARDLMPPEAAVRAFWQELQAQLRAAGRAPEDFPGVRNSTEAQWLHDLATQLAQERLVRAELDLRAEEPVSGDMMKLWLQEARRKTRVVTDPESLPPGCAARVGDHDIPLLDLGLLLLRTSEDDERDKFVRQVVYLQGIEALARQHDALPGATDLEQELARRRREAANDPAYRGASFDQLLQAQGYTPATLRQLRTFRAQVMLRLLAAKLYPDADLLAELQRDRAGVLDLAGPRRRIGGIFVRALAEPNGIVPRDFAAATAHLVALQPRLAKEPFDAVARVETEEPSSKLRGGDLGWHHRRGSQLPEPVLAAAFAAAVGDVHGPVQEPNGCWLVKLHEVEPELADLQIVQRLRDHRAQELSQRILTDAKIEFAAAATPTAGEARK
jgi:hypothetical protein